MQKLWGLIKKLGDGPPSSQTEVALAQDTGGYEQERMLARLQSMKANFMKWEIFISNEASTGLYYAQTHNRTICLRKIGVKREAKPHLSKLEILSDQCTQTLKELEGIAVLSQPSGWADQANSAFAAAAEQLLAKHALKQQ